MALVGMAPAGISPTGMALVVMSLVIIRFFRIDLPVLQGIFTILRIFYTIGI